LRGLRKPRRLAQVDAVASHRFWYESGKEGLMRILITGGSGYIGSRIVERLAERESVEQVINVDVKPPPLRHGKLRHVGRSVDEDLRDLFTDGRIDIALHLAWVVDPMHAVEKQRSICIGGTQRFLDGCVAGEVPHVFFMSSGSADGAPPAHGEPLAEPSPLRRQHHFSTRPRRWRPRSFAVALPPIGPIPCCKSDGPAWSAVRMCRTSSSG